MGVDLPVKRVREGGVACACEPTGRAEYFPVMHGILLSDRSAFFPPPVRAVTKFELLSRCAKPVATTQRVLAFCRLRNHGYRSQCIHHADTFLRAESWEAAASGKDPRCNYHATLVFWPSRASTTRVLSAPESTRALQCRWCRRPGQGSPGGCPT